MANLTKLLGDHIFSRRNAVQTFLHGPKWLSKNYLYHLKCLSMEPGRCFVAILTFDLSSVWIRKWMIFFTWSRMYLPLKTNMLTWLENHHVEYEIHFQMGCFSIVMLVFPGIFVPVTVTEIFPNSSCHAIQNMNIRLLFQPMMADWWLIFFGLPHLHSFAQKGVYLGKL